MPDAGANAEALAEDNRRLEAELREMQSQMQSREASDAISRVQLGSRAQEAEARADEAEEAAEEAAARSPVQGGGGSASSRNCDVATQALRLNTL